MTSTVPILNFSDYLVSMARVYVHMGFLVIAGIMAALAADYFVPPVLWGEKSREPPYHGQSPRRETYGFARAVQLSRLKPMAERKTG